LQLQLDFLGMQDGHNFKLILVRRGAAHLAVAEEFVYGSPSAGFSGFHADTFFS
jgi:hypothetical protein